MRIRDKEIFVLFIIAFAFVFILICAGYSAISNWLWQYSNNKTSYEYSENFYIHSVNSYMATYVDFNQASEDGYYDLYEDDMRIQAECLELCDKDASDMVDILSKQDNTTYICFSINAGESDGYQDANFVISYKEEWYQDLAEGEYPSLNSNGIYAVIGENLIPETVTKNGKMYIWIANKYVEVTGITENYSSSGEDCSLIIFGGENFISESEKCQDRLAELLNNDEIYFVMGGNESLVSEDKLESDIENNESLYLGEPGYILGISLARQEESASANLWEYMYNIKLFVICFMVLFAVCNCAVLSRVWAVRRRKDFLVMSIYGLENREIMKLVFKEQLVMAGTGLVIGALASAIYISASSGWNTSFHMALWFVTSLVIGLFLILFCCMLSVYFYIRRLKPSQATRL